MQNGCCAYLASSFKFSKEIKLISNFYSAALGLRYYVLMKWIRYPSFVARAVVPAMGSTGSELEIRLAIGFGKLRVSGPRPQ